ncbi:MAG TPA: 16S rRNA (cytosine(1402)-N(4))-methyltransferase RsmH [Candidatus Hydrogenedentes bacterium]|nr:16S rRNA (cytosine(1402)-N(4))-methyltransferase RsmH [Candidatus Hydrogenedentota bacterium]HOV73070.1 16S rRNA (cytosine(1402)-N(4))-methyltransferase RsmH [Candidatus Hydrogenedentota bacterium]HPC16170.1 16S rRNA (cytosine(1402)-N(4))-methyltransferase RsmH [Candidatus Hydrogenedentota bacterium]HRT18618.1 16S rRNA (cytosine(1402)-N(4))-methyltransferase RsmH [Candidatus Hydrogenedentota bacterium]
MHGHVPVLAQAVVDGLCIRKDGIYVDGTVGAGGHAALIAERLRGGRLIAMDCDPESVACAHARLAPFPWVTLLHRNYGELAQVLAELDIGRVDGILIDAGVSSVQLDDPRRGFTFQQEGPLDMRLDTSKGVTAAQWLARIREDELAQILRAYGDVGPARRIARAILKRARRDAMKTSGDLAGAVSEALDFVHGMPEETRTVFQAIRIAVNEEYRWLEAGLRQGVEVLAPGGRIVVISFHSGEDRIVKRVFQEFSRKREIRWPDGRVRDCIPPRMRILTPKPIQPDEEEIRRNPRAHSARLRMAEKLAP